MSLILFIAWMASWDDGESAKSLAKIAWTLVMAIHGLSESVCGKWWR